MYNANKYKDAVEPLKKATELDPRMRSLVFAWHSTVGSMGFKKSAIKMCLTCSLERSKAYQHAIDLDPNGPWGQQAKPGARYAQPDCSWNRNQRKHQEKEIVKS